MACLLVCEVRREFSRGGLVLLAALVPTSIHPSIRLDIRYRGEVVNVTCATTLYCNHGAQVMYINNI